MKKKMLALLLAAALLLSLAACARNEDPGNTPASPDNTAVPEYVYKADYSEIRSSERSMEAIAYTDEGFYAQVYEVIGQEEVPEDELMEEESLPEVRTAEGEPSEGEPAEETPRMRDVYGYNLYFVTYDGQIRQLDKYAPLDAQENEEGYKEFYSGSYMEGATLTDDGNLIVIEYVYVSYYDGPETVEQYSDEYYNYYHHENSYYIRTLNGSDGSEISGAQVAIDTENSYISAYNAVSDSKGNLLVTGDEGVIAIAPDGSVAYKIEVDNWVQSIVRLGGGKLGVTYWGMTGYVLGLVDMETGKVTEEVPVPDGAYDLISGDDTYDFYYTSGVNLYGYRVETEQAEKLLNWISCDISNEDLNSIHIRSDGTITGVINTWDSNYEKVTTELVTLSLVPYDSVPHKESLTLAVQYYDSWLLGRAVIAFNRSNDKYRIDVLDYSEYNTEDDYNAGRTKLTTEMISGNMPDIIALDGMPYTQLAAKGLLEDLYPYIEAESGLSKDDFFENILTALEVNGGLYRMCASFNIQTVVGASNIVGDAPGWTYEEFYEALARMPEGCDPFNVYTTKDDILYNCLAMDMNSFVNWATGECRFDSDGFIKLLEFANQFPAEFDWNNYDYTMEDDEATRLVQGKQMLRTTNLWDFRSLQYDKFYFGDDDNITYIGYPTSDGSSGSAISLSSSFAISAKSANKQAAWEFLYGFLLGEDVNYNYMGGMPIRKSVFNEKLKEAMTPQYRKDYLTGELLLDENGEPIKESFGGIGFGNGEMHELYETSQAEADRLMELINSTTKVYESNNTILEMVTERVAPYFAGQQDAQTVARNIQSAVNLYVNEQR